MGVIFCDTDGELWYDKVEELGLKVIRMPYSIDGQEYLADSGETYDYKDFFGKLRNKIMSTTSGLNSEIYKEYFEPYFAQGEEILYIAFSSKMSSTFDQLELAISELKEKYPNAKFTKFDTLSICMGCGIQTYLAGKYWKEGHSIDEVVEYLKVITNQISTAFIVNDLHHLQRGGRLSAGAAVIGTLLDIKPYLKVDNEGKLTVTKKIRGRKLAIQELFKQCIDNITDWKDCPICILDADCKNDADILQNKILEVHPDAVIWRQPIGPVIGTHCGPDTLGIIFKANSRG